MKRPIAIIIVLAVLVGGVFYTRKIRNPEPETVPAPAAPAATSAPAAAPQADTILGATLLEGLGNHHFEVTTSKPEAQRWFNQALMLTYGFNHDAAERSFLRRRSSIRIARCAGGARRSCSGLTSMPQMDPANNAKAWERLQTAVALAARATDRARGFIPRSSRVMQRARRKTASARRGLRRGHGEAARRNIPTTSTRR